MMEDIKPKDLGAVGLLITPKTRLNFFKQNDDFNLWSNERFMRLTQAIQYFTGKTSEENSVAAINLTDDSKTSSLLSYLVYEVRTRY